MKSMNEWAGVLLGPGEFQGLSRVSEGEESQKRLKKEVGLNRGCWEAEELAFLSQATG